MPRTKGSKNKTTKAIKTTKRVIKPYTNVDQIATDVRGVIRSLCNKTGEFDAPTATAISKLYGNELTRMKLQLDVHKLNHTTVKVNDILTLS